MAIRPVDRDVNYMKENWGTTSLITDYISLDAKVIQEVMYDPALNYKKASKSELYEKTDDLEENDFVYGVEPTYKIDKNQKLLRE
jgi:hypothetical protein